MGMSPLKKDSTMHMIHQLSFQCAFKSSPSGMEHGHFEAREGAMGQKASSKCLEFTLGGRHPKNLTRWCTIGRERDLHPFQPHMHVVVLCRD